MSKNILQNNQNEWETLTIEHSKHRVEFLRRNAEQETRELAKSLISVESFQSDQMRDGNSLHGEQFLIIKGQI